MFFLISLLPASIPGKLQLINNYELAYAHWDLFFHLFSQQNLLSRLYFQDQLENQNAEIKVLTSEEIKKKKFLKMLNDFSKKHQSGLYSTVRR